MNPVALVQKARATRRALVNAPVPGGWTREAVKTQLRLAAGRLGRTDGLVEVKVDRFDVTGFSVSSLAYLHWDIFVGLEYYFKAFRRDPFIVDGGSNIGMSVLFFKALYPEARVLAFEPAQRAYELLVRNIEANRLCDVEFHRAALGRENGEVPFFEDQSDPATFRMSTRAERLTGSEGIVRARRLSELVTQDVDLLKLDVEGAEDDVLADLIESGAISRVRQLVVEYHHHLDPKRDFIDGFLGRLREQGFRYQLSATKRMHGVPGLPMFQDVLVNAERLR